MFTGLIETTASVQRMDLRQGGFVLTLQKPETWTDLKQGESIAVDGACLTLTGWTRENMAFFVTEETIAKTSLGKLSLGQSVNLERALQFGSRVGGHLVSGHVDGIAKVIKKESRGESVYMELEVHRAHEQWIVPKGSITVNGVSLTVNERDRHRGVVSLMLIPETLTITNLKNLEVGALVNIECDQTVKVIVEQLKWAKESHELHT